MQNVRSPGFFLLYGIVHQIPVHFFCQAAVAEEIVVPGDFFSEVVFRILRVQEFSSMPKRRWTAGGEDSQP